MDSNQNSYGTQNEQIQEILRFVRSAQQTMLHSSDTPTLASTVPTALSPGPTSQSSSSLAPEGFGRIATSPLPQAGINQNAMNGQNLTRPMQEIQEFGFGTPNNHMTSFHAGSSSVVPSPSSLTSVFGSHQQSRRFSSSLGNQFVGSHGAPQTSSRISSVGEMRRNFAPYPTTSRRRGGFRPSSQASASPVMIDLNIFCLGGPQDINPPTNERRRELVSQYLGPSIVTVDRTATGDVVRAGIQNQFPQLLGIGFELVRASGQGYGSLLTRIQHSTPVPGVSAIIKSRATQVYVRPFQEIIAEESSDGDLDVHQRNPTPPPTDGLTSVSNNEGSQILEQHTRTTCNRSQSGHSNIRTSGGFHFEAVATTSQLRGEENFATLEEYRNQMFRQNPGEQLIVIHSRSNFIEELQGTYKNPEFNFKKKTHVVFSGEQGRDVNGVSREFFSCGIEKLNHGRVGNHALLQGEMDFRLPSCHPTLLSAGVYRILGKFMAHSAIHLGVGFVGMSKSILRFVLSKDFDDVSLVKIEDIPDVENRNVVKQLLEMTSGRAPDVTTLQEITHKLREAGIYESLERTNLHLIAQQFLLHCTIYSRLPSLKEVREGFVDTGFFEVLAQHEYFVEAAFPSTHEADISADDILNKVTYFGYSEPHHSAIKQRFVTFVRSLGTAERKRLLEAWTGAAMIPRDGLGVRMTLLGPIAIQTCLSQMTISASCDLETELTRFCTYGARGFGAI